MFVDSTNNPKSLCETLTNNVRKLLREWVVLPDVIGGSIFGGSVKYSGANQGLKKEEQELKV